MYILASYFFQKDSKYVNKAKNCIYLYLSIYLSIY